MAPAGLEGHGVILFDGTCAFCERSVRFIATRDPGGYFRFGASQNAAGAALLAAHGVTREATRSLVLIEDGRLYLRSTAVLRVARRLSFPWWFAAAALVVPEAAARPRLPRRRRHPAPHRRALERVRNTAQGDS